MYNEIKNPLTGKGNRHRTSALRSILGLNKSIIEEPEPEPVIVPTSSRTQKNRDAKFPSSFWNKIIENDGTIKWEINLENKGIGEHDINLVVIGIKGRWVENDIKDSWKVMYYWTWEKEKQEKRIKGRGVSKYDISNFISLEIQPDVKSAKKTIAQFKDKARLDDYKRFSRKSHTEIVSKFLGQ